MFLNEKKQWHMHLKTVRSKHKPPHQLIFCNTADTRQISFFILYTRHAKTILQYYCVCVYRCVYVCLISMGINICYTREKLLRCTYLFFPMVDWGDFYGNWRKIAITKNKKTKKKSALMRREGNAEHKLIAISYF